MSSISIGRFGFLNYFREILDFLSRKSTPVKAPYKAGRGGVAGIIRSIDDQGPRQKPMGGVGTLPANIDDAGIGHRILFQRGPLPNEKNSSASYGITSEGPE